MAQTEYNHQDEAGDCYGCGDNQNQFPRSQSKQMSFTFLFCDIADVKDGLEVTVAQIVVLAAADNKCVIQWLCVVAHDRILGRVQKGTVQASVRVREGLGLAIEGSGCEAETICFAGKVALC